MAISGWHIACSARSSTAALGGLARRPRSLIVLVAICCVLDPRRRLAEHPARGGDGVASCCSRASRAGAGQAPAALALTVLGLLLLDPATVTDVGFQLSVAATAGLLVWSKAPRATGSRRVCRAGRPAWLLEALAVSLAAQAATLPLILFHFASLSLVAPLANLLIAPLVAPAMLLTVVWPSLPAALIGARRAGARCSRR